MCWGQALDAALPVCFGHVTAPPPVRTTKTKVIMRKVIVEAFFFVWRSTVMRFLPNQGTWRVLKPNSGNGKRHTKTQDITSVWASRAGIGVSSGACRQPWPGLVWTIMKKQGRESTDFKKMWGVESISFVPFKHCIMYELGWIRPVSNWTTLTLWINKHQQTIYSDSLRSTRFLLRSAPASVRWNAPVLPWLHSSLPENLHQKRSYPATFKHPAKVLCHMLWFWKEFCTSHWRLLKDRSWEMATQSGISTDRHVHHTSIVPATTSSKTYIITYYNLYKLPGFYILYMCVYMLWPVFLTCFLAGACLF